jgi:hypothetical protein
MKRKGEASPGKLAKLSDYVRFCALSARELAYLAIAPPEILSHDLTK